MIVAIAQDTPEARRQAATHLRLIKRSKQHDAGLRLQLRFLRWKMGLLKTFERPMHERHFLALEITATQEVLRLFTEHTKDLEGRYRLLYRYGNN